MKIIILIVFLVLASNAKTFEQAFNIKTTKAKFQTKKVTKSYYATTSYDESRIYEVSLRFDGFIETLYADELYKSFKVGDKLFEIYSKEIFTLKSELDSSRDFKKIQSTILQKLKLYDLDSEAINAKGESVSIKSKFNGFVVEKNVFKGSYVKAGSTLFKIADSSKMWVIAKVYQKDLAFVKEGMSVSVNIEGFVQPIEAKVSKIYPKINKEDLSFDVRVDLDNKDAKIFPDMFAKVHISKDIKEALTLPKEAIVKRDGKLFVFTKISKTEYEPQEVSAKYMGGYYEVFSGVNENTEVVVNALFLLDSDAQTNGYYMSEEW
ncbi:MAG: efflux RND transporter periplasmic adaptor subunit [Sulfurimonas sp.]|uniref:HlyD family efflux transporter periplasmic adaptor subunit n=1 Tax=Sulfurimonas sp. TaxID=2022749 RepID=UPI0025D77AA2|nr:HlyD family efflux transporter periplasmic adaptor subunit [Sulfurimonas sp.]MCK9491046.1 efflux RND transporter periplasmic adaptor subunit [Sulfurimonas sp.]